MNAAEVVAIYGSTWNEADEAERRRLLERAWADDGVYCDPTVELHGRDALLEHITSFRQSFAGARIDTTSGVEEHHGFVRFSWRMIDGSGAVVTDGFDVGQLDGEGRLELIVGFFGPFPPPE